MLWKKCYASDRLKAAKFLSNFVDKREDLYKSVTALFQLKVLKIMLYQSYMAAGSLPNVTEKI